jgi:cobalt-zinc-cadmium efflux system outer membrane protein
MGKQRPQVGQVIGVSAQELVQGTGNGAAEAAPAPYPLQGDASRPPSPDTASTPLGLEAALEWTLAGNPDLVALRQNLGVSAEAVEVARRFPMSLNPTLSVDVRPWVFERVPGEPVNRLETLVSVSLSQPLELGHRRSHRVSIAEAAYSQTRWNILQAELSALVQTYRLYETAVYRREKLRVATKLAEFNNRLLQTLRRQLEANQVSAADVVLAEVENQSTTQHVETARQEYVAAVADLRQQIGMRQQAGWVEPTGALKLPESLAGEDEAALLQTALGSRPEIQAARAQVAGSHAAVSLARADRIPVPSLGPAYEKDEAGVSFYGMVLSSPVPVLNTGKSLVRQREAEHCRDLVALQQVQQKVALQVKAALARWNQAQQLVSRTVALSEPIEGHAARMQRLFEAGQTDLVKLFQVRQRLIEAENTRLDAVWQATQAHAELLTALGATSLMGSLPSLPEPPAKPEAAPE